MSQHRDEDDFLGWAPAQPLEFESQQSSGAQPPAAPHVQPAPGPVPTEEPGSPFGGRPRQQRQPTPPPLAQTAKAAPGTRPAASVPVAPTPAGRALRPPTRRFGIALLGFGLLLLFTVLTAVSGLTDGTGVGPLPAITAIATLMFARAAWAMRPR